MPESGDVGNPRGYRIRSAGHSDVPVVRALCLTTGDAGKDAAPLFHNSALIGDYYAAPYVALEPEVCHLLERTGGAVVGYVVGTSDTAEFGRRCEREWFPKLRRQTYVAAKSPLEARLLSLLRAGHPQTLAYPGYPAHLHINLLPAARGGGWGRRLMDCFVKGLREKHVEGVHLGVGKRNAAAVAFYRRLGFVTLDTSPSALVLGQRLR